mmetsp:Transcript_21779/g.33236  ORF Transcript_21779/g.33236 Transcript_21779/m.33236 type:complete len:277 (+) Transcript_21779:65-895(+)
MPRCSLLSLLLLLFTTNQEATCFTTTSTTHSRPAAASFVRPSTTTRRSLQHSDDNNVSIEARVSSRDNNNNNNNSIIKNLVEGTREAFLGLSLMVLLGVSSCSLPVLAATDSSGGASIGANAKITTGGASTLQSGRTIAITRGVNLDNSDFAGQNLKGVAFQQSIVRYANFKSANLVGSSFFDATLDGSNFENADLTLANVEMAQFKNANLKNVVAREMYVSGATLFDGVADISNSDWTDTMLRKDQKKYLCEHPTAKGTNPTTGVDTRESLMCLD